MLPPKSLIALKTTFPDETLPRQTGYAKACLAERRDHAGIDVVGFAAAFQLDLIKGHVIWRWVICL